MGDLAKKLKRSLPAWPRRRYSIFSGTNTTGEWRTIFLHWISWRTADEESVIARYESAFANRVSVKHAVSFGAGRMALYAILEALGIGEGDEVIVPTITFIAPVNAITYNGADPVFMDSDYYYNIDVIKTIEFINKETIFKDGFTYNKKTDRRITAIIPVHVFGHAVWLDELIQLCEDRNISIVEDAAESMGSHYTIGEYSGKHTGTIGKLGCLSFNGNKIMTTGGGGMVLTDDEQLADSAKYLTNQAKNDGVRYIHNEIGYNFRLSNIQAALGVAQLKQLPVFLKRKREIFSRYQTAVDSIAGLTLAGVPDYANNNHWINILGIDQDVYGRDRETLMSYLKTKGIQTRPVWYPNHLQKPYKNCQHYNIERANKLVDISLCLPSSNRLSDEEISIIVSALNG